MTVDSAGLILREMVMVATRVAGPILLLSMVIGVIISIFQAATQIHEQTITFVPKLIIIVLFLFAAGAWVMTTLGDFTTSVFNMMIQ